MRQLLRCVLFAFVALACAIPNFSYADATPVGPSFVVNSPGMEGIQARVAMARDGEFAVVWMKNATKQILLRRFSKTGQPLGPEVAVTKPGSDGAAPEIASDPTGGYVVCWLFGALADAGIGPPILARRFDANGNPKDPSAILVSQSTNSFPRIAVRSDGAFVVAWNAYGALGDVNAQHVFARTFNAQGVPYGAPFRLGARTGVAQFHPDVAFTSAGGFLATWAERPLDATYYDLSQWHVYLRYWGLAGLNKDPIEHRIDVSPNNGFGFDPAAASNARGDVVVGWFPGKSRRFTGTGIPLESEEFDTGGGYWNFFVGPSEQELGIDASGGMVFAEKGSRNEVDCWRFDHSATPREAAPFQCSDVVYPFRVDPTGPSDPNWNPDVAVAADGSFVVVWYDQGDRSPTYGTIRARLFKAP